MRTSSSSEPVSPAWWPPPSSRTRAGRCCCSTRRASSRSAGRRGGRSAGCSSSTRRSSGGCGSRTAMSSPGRTGSAPPASTATRTTGRAGGRRPTSTSPAARSAPGCAAMGHRVFPIVGWAERGGYTATGHGNSVPRFHITWGTGPGIVEPFERRVRAAADRGRVQFRFRHQVDELTVTGAPGQRQSVDGVRGTVLEPTTVLRGQASSRTPVGRVRAARAGGRRHQPAASAATTTSCARPGRSGSASRPST